jgi:hypothetical protein
MRLPHIAVLLGVIDMNTMTLADIVDLQKRANTVVKKRSGGELSQDDKAKILAAIGRVADGASVQGAAEEFGVNQYMMRAFVKGTKKVDLLV